MGLGALVPDLITADAPQREHRVCYEITISFLLAWEDGVIPLSVEGVPLEMELLHGLLRDFDPSWIRVLIQLAYNCQPRRGRRGRNEVHNYLVTHERLPAPVLADEGEQPMLDLVPLARPWREVGHGDLQPRLIREPLEFQFPQTHARPITPPAIRRDQQGPGLRVSALPHRLPPAANTLHGESRRVVIRPHVDPARIPRHIVDAIGRDPPEGRKDEIIDAHGHRLPGRVPFPPSILEVAHEFFLLGIHGDDRLPGLQGGLDLGINIGKLGIPVWVTRALQRLAVGLETVAQVVEEGGDNAMTGGVPQAAEFLGQLPHTLARPAQRGLGVASRQRVNQLLQIVLERLIGLYCPLATAPRAADAMGRRRLGGVQFGQPRSDRSARDSGGTRDPRDPTSPERCSFGSREEPTRPLVEKWR